MRTWFTLYLLHKNMLVPIKARKDEERTSEKSQYYLPILLFTAFQNEKAGRDKSDKGEDQENPKEEPKLEAGTIVTHLGNSETFHGIFTVAFFQPSGDKSLSVNDQLVQVLVHVELRPLHLLLLPCGSSL